MNKDLGTFVSLRHTISLNIFHYKLNLFREVLQDITLPLRNVFGDTY